jgi:ParB family chromosome partitioning protein
MNANTGKPSGKNRFTDLLKSSVAQAAAEVSTPKPSQDTVSARFDKADHLIENPNSTPSPSRPQGSHVAQTNENITAENVEIMIDIALLEDNPYNARQIYDEHVVQDRAASMASDKGQMEAVKVANHPEKPGSYVLIDGHYRKRGALRIGWTQLRCTIRKVASKLDLYRLSYALNDEHATQTALDNALAWKKLLEDGVAADLAQIESITGKKVPKISKTLSLLDLPSEVLEKLREKPEKISLEIGYELTLFFKDRGLDATLATAARVVAEDLSKRDIASLRKRAVSNATRERSRQYKIGGTNGAQIGLIKDFDDGRVELKIKITDPEERVALIEELKRRLGHAGTTQP